MKQAPCSGVGIRVTCDLVPEDLGCESNGSPKSIIVSSVRGTSGGDIGSEATVSYKTWD